MYVMYATTCCAFLFSAKNFASKMKLKFQVKLADPGIVSDPKEYQKVAQSVAELDEVV